MILSKFANNLTNYCESNHYFGMLRITKQDRIIHQQNFGFADLETKTLFTKDSMFTLYSLSKPFCAIGLMKLKDRGLVDLSSHPSRYVPEALGFDERVTIRQMLHHASGLPDFEQNKEFNKQYAPGYAHKAREHVKLLTAYPSYFAPDTGSKYANINMLLCALIIENVTGLRYADYMKQEVFAPLGMKTAVVDDERLVIPNRVTGYELQDNTPVAVEKSHDWLFGAGDIVATVDDVYCLNLAIKHKKLLSEESWNEILTKHPLSSFGMGCTVMTWHGKKRIHHNGGHTGFRTLHVQLPEDDFDLIYLSNSGFGNARNEIAEMVYEAFYGESDAAGEVAAMDQGYI